MSDPSLPLQAALIAELRNNVGTEVGDRVYDAAPADAAFPYVTLGDCQVLPDKADCIDGTEVYFQIDVWSRAVGYPEVKTVAGEILGILDDRHDDVPAMVITDFVLVLMEVEQVRFLRDPDGLSSHAALQFRALIQPQ